jgi:SAM-dependent methyltransferase
MDTHSNPVLAPHSSADSNHPQQPSPVSSIDLDTLNRKFYQNKQVADWYGSKSFVMPEEQAFLRDFTSEFQGGRALDVGIGAGRSTRYLLPLVGQYVGFDYAREMVEQAMLQFPNANLGVQDARDLSAYPKHHFDLVLFSFNGIDCLSHDGRLCVLREIHRVLKPNGLFAFSSHNRERPVVAPYARENLPLSRNPVTLLRNIVSYVSGIRNWLGTRQLATDTLEYAQRHDSGNHFKVPAYYISKSSQAAQLCREGFALEKLYNRQGQTSTITAKDSDSSWIFYVSRAVSTTDSERPDQG